MPTPIDSSKLLARLAALRAETAADHAAQLDTAASLGPVVARTDLTSALANARAQAARKVDAAAHANGGTVPMATAHAWWNAVERLVVTADLAPELSFTDRVRVLRDELGAVAGAVQTGGLFVLAAQDNSFERTPTNVMALVDSELRIAVEQLRAGHAGTLPMNQRDRALMRALVLPEDVVNALFV